MSVCLSVSVLLSVAVTVSVSLLVRLFNFGDKTAGVLSCSRHHHALPVARGQGAGQPHSGDVNV